MPHYDVAFQALEGSVSIVKSQLIASQVHAIKQQLALMLRLMTDLKANSSLQYYFQKPCCIVWEESQLNPKQTVTKKHTTYTATTFKVLNVSDKWATKSIEYKSRKQLKKRCDKWTYLSTLFSVGSIQRLQIKTAYHVTNIPTSKTKWCIRKNAKVRIRK